MNATPSVVIARGEVGVLGEEAVAGMHAVGAARADRGEDGFGVEVRLGRGLTTERVCLVGEPHVHRIAVELGVHRDRCDAELLARTDHANGDLSAIGDQDLGQHAAHMLTGGGLDRAVRR